MAWQMIEEEISTGKARQLGTYDRRRKGVAYAPAVLDQPLYNRGASLDERDAAIGAFVDNGGKVAVVAAGYQYYLSKRMFDVCGKRIADPRSVIRVNGKAVWKDPDGRGKLQVVVTGLNLPDAVRGKALDGSGTEVEGRASEFTPTS